MSAISNRSLLLLKQLFQVVEIILKEFATEKYTNSLEKITKVNKYRHFVRKMVYYHF